VQPIALSLYQLVTFLVFGFLMVLHHRTSRYFLGPVSVPSAFLGILLDVLILTLFGLSYALQMFLLLLGHHDLLSAKRIAWSSPDP
jgi:hypothetical protein